MLNWEIKLVWLVKFFLFENLSANWKLNLYIFYETTFIKVRAYEAKIMMLIYKNAKHIILLIKETIY